MSAQEGGASPSQSNGTRTTPMEQDIPAPQLPQEGRMISDRSQRRGKHTPAGIARAELGRAQVHRPMMPAVSGRAAPSQDRAQDPSEQIAPLDDEADAPCIWGTTINKDVIRSKVRRFFTSYRAAGSDVNVEPKYVAMIRAALSDRSCTLNLDTGDLRAFDMTLYHWLVDYPLEVTAELDALAKEIAVSDCGFESDLPPPQAYELCSLVVRAFNLADVKSIRLLDPADIGKLVTVRGMVTRTSPVIPNLRFATFECAACHHEVPVANEDGNVMDPPRCPACNKAWCMELQHNKGIYLDKQLVKVQESPNDIPEGETPLGVTAYAYEALVDVSRPGDRVAITGIYRAAPFKVNPRQSALHAMFRTYIDIVHVQRDESKRLFSLAAQKEADLLAVPPTPANCSQGPSQTQGTQAMDVEATLEAAEDQFMALETVPPEQLAQVEAEIKALSRDQKLVSRLVASLAPNIWEMDDIKKGVLCLMFGGVPKSFPGGKIRGDLNVLLVGDPSVSKSQLLTYVHQLAPRGIYTSGKGSSAVGLTAYVSKDPETREMVLESGALVLADKGVCCIDEFDKMSDSARSMLHEAMEQQTVSVAKAGLISTLNARCSILACANPVGSRYNPQLSIAENINLPPTLLTRFDLIYLILDTYEESRDRRLARHLVSLYHPGAQTKSKVSEQELVSPELLKRYIAYARTRIKPRLSDEAAEELIGKYQMMRRDGRARKVVVATPRQLESLIRLSESLARMRLDEVVTVADVNEAVRLWYNAMSGSASSNSNSEIDLTDLFTGTTSEQRAAIQQLPADIEQALRGLAASGSSVAVAVDDLLNELNNRMAAAAAAGGHGHSGGGGGGSARRMGRAQLVGVLRTLGDAVVFDEATMTVRPRSSSGAGAGSGGGGAAAVPAAIAVA